MGCGCNKNKDYAFVHYYPEGETGPNGETEKEYRTEVEARAAKIRSGGEWAKIAK